MKRIITATFVALAAMTSALAQYYNGEPVGTVYEYEMSNPLMGKMIMTRTLDAIDGKAYTFSEKTQMPGQAQAIEATHIVTIADGKIMMEAESIIAATKQSVAATLGDIDVTLEGEIGYTPLEGKVGDTFPLNKYTVKMGSPGVFEITTVTDVVRHEIVREEEITIPAGTFKTIVLELDSKSSTNAMGQSQSFDVKTTQWIVPGKGIVKIEQTTAGQMITTVLTKITKP